VVYVDYFDIKDSRITIPPLMILRLVNPLGFLLFEHELAINFKLDAA
jgi:hypothetical protein